VISRYFGELHVVIGALEPRELLQVEGGRAHHQQDDETHGPEPEDLRISTAGH
jgi:hypothetical protein